ncbi:MAG: SAM-dependent methyltransferase [Gemmatimonadales bacterium]|jgi:precorrin-4 methylase|nr:SAM-dependent methyltransferase [Gemmatimonadales bacterium]
MTISRLAVAVVVALSAGAIPRVAAAAPGRFYVVGTGSAPDLITLRALDVIKRADIFILEGDGDRQFFKDHIGKREVWIAPKYLRVFLGIDPKTLKEPAHRAAAQKNARQRQELIDRIRRAVGSGKVVAALQAGDPMMYGTTFYFELLPKGFPSEIVPGVGAFQSTMAAVKASPVYGWDTSSVILTMDDWPGRLDTNERLMALQASMMFYTMHVDYPALFAQLAKHYPKDTPVAVVSFAGDPKQQRVIRSTVGKFLNEVAYRDLPPEMHTLVVGKFLTAGQARKDGILHGAKWIERHHGREGKH